jgi:ABC-type polar amino acid transport system ATPase subunit
MTSALRIRGLRVTRGDREILHGIDLDVAPGEVCVLMGASGSGKSTALRTVAALQAFSAGSVAVGNVSLQPGAVPPESRLTALRSKVGMVFQAHALFEHLSALDNVTLAPIHVLGWTRTRAETVARELLRTLDVEARASAMPRQLSGGEAQRVAIARALAPDPMVLLMDEPTAALDPLRRDALGATVRRLAESGRAILIASHDVEWAEQYSHRRVMLAGGVITGE